MDVEGTVLLRPPELPVRGTPGATGDFLTDLVFSSDMGKLRLQQSCAFEDAASLSEHRAWKTRAQAPHLTRLDSMSCLQCPQLGMMAGSEETQAPVNRQPVRPTREKCQIKSHRTHAYSLTRTCGSPTGDHGFTYAALSSEQLRPVNHTAAKDIGSKSHHKSRRHSTRTQHAADVCTGLGTSCTLPKSKHQYRAKFKCHERPAQGRSIRPTRRDKRIFRENCRKLH